MILPEHIKIGFEIYNVAVGSGIEGEGECLPEKGSILVKPGMSDRRYAATIIHEVLHACWDQAELPEGDADLAGLKEEDVIARLSNLLTAALLDSPQLRQMLERVAGAANGNCWKPGLIVNVVMDLPVDKPDNARRNDRLCPLCGRETYCEAVNCSRKL